jgi:hypothetical protein
MRGGSSLAALLLLALPGSAQYESSRRAAFGLDVPHPFKSPVLSINIQVVERETSRLTATRFELHRGDDVEPTIEEFLVR